MHPTITMAEKINKLDAICTSKLSFAFWAQPISTSLYYMSSEADKTNEISNMRSTWHVLLI